MPVCSVTYTVVTIVLLASQSAVGEDNNNNDCSTNSDCAKNRVCTDQKCVDPCQAGICAKNTLCHVADHVPRCACKPDYHGHPFSGCILTTLTDDNNHKEPADTFANSQKKAFYLFSNSKMNWYQSLAHCISLNMRLATINNEEEQAELVDLIKKADVKIPGRWWIGASDLGQMGNVIWISAGTPLTYHHYPPGQPDNAIYPNGVMEHCTEIRPDWKYEWNDYICDYQQYHVCEKR